MKETKEAEHRSQETKVLVDEKGKGAGKAFLIGIYTERESQEKAEEHVNELELLTETYQIPIVGKWVTSLRDISPSTFLSKGKVEMLREKVDEVGANIVIFDDEITPAQQRNLEQALKLRVMDRAEVILGVFASRARTHEAKLQIELAQIKYTTPRLKRMWTHLSRQAGGGGGASGGGYLKGTGEKQIETDKRLLKNRLEKLEKELKEVRASRNRQKVLRERNQVPVFAIVGYTNAGKSTLMNFLTHANVYVEDKLFATLDTTTRHLSLPNHQSLLLTDTVGFIRKLPHLLVASFKSTLEEAVQADFLLHVIDASHPQAIDQAKTTMEVLRELKARDKNCITLLNKVDLIDDPHHPHVRENVQKLRLLYPGAIPISAKTGEGVEAVKTAMMETLRSRCMRVQLSIPQKEYQAVADILANATLFSKEYVDNDIHLDVELPTPLALKYLQAYSSTPLEPMKKEEWE